ncbi:MAG: bifunctional proline dehydrogenase/L-glutamate gamma-semialdehyde dehydrogenase PutA [Alphaproteobacteria bacterium]|nr:bifunctional proline dehydrogenase/L-glutamate gamma-semialdehyde dehydrogenase PutA [Alphaproteobacteria bacterium]
MSETFASWKFKSEPECVAALLNALPQNEASRQRVTQQARVLIDGARAHKGMSRLHTMVEGFSLSSREGIALMALAEALLRIPDAATIEAMLEDKLSDADFERLFGQATDWISKVSGFGLKLTQSVMGGMSKRMGMPVIRRAAVEGVKILGGAFVMGESIEDALSNANDHPRQIAWSFDMLGEGARTTSDAEKYFNAYAHAISVVGRSAVDKNAGALKRHGISVKLSALHPRYNASQAARCVPELAERLTELCRLAAETGLNLTVDAEESERLALSLQIIDKALQAPYLKGWDGFGMAVQAYQKRSFPLLRELITWSVTSGRKLGIRLVKGAYWDSEIKRAQVGGLPDYPVFTRKSHTDLSYLACAQMLMDNRSFVTPMFGTHNATTAAAILDMAGNNRNGFSFQRLFGMGEGLHAQLMAMDLPCSVYAPVGPHTQLLAYLVRRLLENGANASFVNRIADKTIPTDKLIDDPAAKARETKGRPHPKIVLPASLFAPERTNSSGYDIAEREPLKALEEAARKSVIGITREAVSIVGGQPRKGSLPLAMRSPADSAVSVSQLWPADEGIVSDAFLSVAEGARGWRTTPPDARAAILEKTADLLEQHRDEFVGLCSIEAGKTLADGIAEVREAVDFCRYYASQARKLFGIATNLPGPTGEQNTIRLEPRGIFAAVSPWNFPLAIFAGQVTAALAAGNTVVAKPAEQTPFIAMRAVQLMLEAGLPANAIALVQGDGRVGEMVVSNRRVAGVVFTGSNAAAKAIHKSLADRPGPIVPLIAETGGINAMIVDSTALPEQVVDDAVLSAFTSAGQRCSALRLLCVQEDIADTVIDMLAGAMADLNVGNPADAATDIGPLIDEEALAVVQRHKSRLRGGGRIVAETPLDKVLAARGHYTAPIAAEIRSVDDLDREIFGPVLHILRYKASERMDLLDAINRKGFGLTFGIHSRVWATQKALAAGARAGNVYINRGMIGAVVGVQPFGGMGLSGTGPKAGGPHYLYGFATEKVISVDTTAAGGNTTLVTMDEG